MDYSWETLKAIIEDFKEQNSDRFHGSAYEMVDTNMLKQEEEWRKEEEGMRKGTILTIQTVAGENKEAILNPQKFSNILNVKKGGKGIKNARLVVKGGIKRVLKRKQNTRGRRREGSWWLE
uniref:Uncharacterized protein n=1 Tax=Micrurus lemniscatus lemniscatus TaxID=129467 RepID=A0A2D4IFB7_MICLE